MQYAVLLLFLFTIGEPGLAVWEVAGRIVSMGLMCGVFGINVAHELGHRVNPLEQHAAKALLLTSLERVQPSHSWNFDHMIWRVLLFELSRHSDHHFKSNRKYQILRHLDESPQMPTGYPGMMLLALIPPLWFRIMHARITRLSVG